MKGEIIMIYKKGDTYTTAISEVFARGYVESGVEFEIIEIEIPSVDPYPIAVKFKKYNYDEFVNDEEKDNVEWFSEEQLRILIKGK